MSLSSSTKIQQLAYASLCRPVEPLHAMRFHWPRQRQPGRQCRDHWLISLVEAGRSRLESDAGSVDLQSGLLRVVPAGTPCAVWALDVDGATECQLIATAELVGALRRCLGRQAPAPLPLQAGMPPLLVALSPDRAAAFIALVGELAMRPPDRLCAIAGLGQALRWAAEAEEAARSPYADLPAWLRAALIRMRAPPFLQEGPQALARIAGRCLDHVNRTVRAHRGCTATDLVNELRIELACARLRLTDERIPDIAAIVGLADVSHFYRVFKRLRGCTPRRYRDSGR